MEVENCYENTEKPPKKRRWLYALPVAAVLLILAIIILVAFRGRQEGVLPVTERSFTLNGEDYPLTPVLQDFIDRGWAQGEPVGWSGNYTEEEGPTDIIATRYYLTSGSNRVDALLDDTALRDGEQPSACRLRSLSLYGEDVDSFCLDGKELAKTDSSSIIELLGNPGKVEEEEYGVIYHYSMPEKSISEITFAFPNTLDTVAQIFIVFDIA